MFDFNVVFAMTVGSGFVLGAGAVYLLNTLFKQSTSSARDALNHLEVAKGEVLKAEAVVMEVKVSLQADLDLLG